MSRHDYMTLGQFEAALKKMNPDHEIFFDFGSYIVPNTFGSYRGFYEDAALSYIPAYKRAENPLVKEILELTQRFIGSEVRGYKGGTYLMDQNTTLWVAEPGDTCNCAICGITAYVSYDKVFIETRLVDY